MELPTRVVQDRLGANLVSTILWPDGHYETAAFNADFSVQSAFRTALTEKAAMKNHNAVLAAMRKDMRRARPQYREERRIFP